MRNIARWTVFTAVTTLAWLVGGFIYLVLSRLYAALQLPSAMLFALVAMATVSALAAISYAAKLDDEVNPEEAATAARRSRPKLPGFPGQ